MIITATSREADTCNGMCQRLLCHLSEETKTIIGVKGGENKSDVNYSVQKRRYKKFYMKENQDQD
jgi:hypothetical protein